MATNLISFAKKPWTLKCWTALISHQIYLHFASFLDTGASISSLSLWKIRRKLSHVVNTVPAYLMVTGGSRASAAMELTLFSKNILLHEHKEDNLNVFSRGNPPPPPPPPPLVDFQRIRGSWHLYLYVCGPVLEIAGFYIGIIDINKWTEVLVVDRRSPIKRTRIFIQKKEIRMCYEGMFIYWDIFR